MSKKEAQNSARPKVEEGEDSHIINLRAIKKHWAWVSVAGLLGMCLVVATWIHTVYSAKKDISEIFSSPAPTPLAPEKPTPITISPTGDGNQIITGNGNKNNTVRMLKIP